MSMVLSPMRMGSVPINNVYNSDIKIRSLGLICRASGLIFIKTLLYFDDFDLKITKSIAYLSW